MKEAATITFTDAETLKEAVAIVRYDEALVAICFSHEANGDIEVVMPKVQAKLFLKALQSAVE